MDIRPIRTEADYEAALAEIERLVDAAPGTPEYDKLDVLSTLVEVYEEEHYPIPLPSPIDAIEFHMERLGLTSKDLEPYIGTRTRVNEILNRQRPLTLRMIRNLEKGLGIPAAILVQDYELAQDHQPEKAEPAEDTDAESQVDEAWHRDIQQPAMVGEITP
jgi:HTH-type transcriptional regulator / antitoxin HigA